VVFLCFFVFLLCLEFTLVWSSCGGGRTNTRGTMEHSGLNMTRHVTTCLGALEFGIGGHSGVTRSLCTSRAGSDCTYIPWGRGFTVWAGYLARNGSGSFAFTGTIESGRHGRPRARFIHKRAFMIVRRRTKTRRTYVGEVANGRRLGSKRLSYRG
jgi:hypothetical protein